MADTDAGHAKDTKAEKMPIRNSRNAERKTGEFNHEGTKATKERRKARGLVPFESLW